MTLQKESQTTWFRVTADVRRSGPVSCLAGLLFGLMLVVEHRYFGGGQLGNALMQERVSFYSLALMLIFLLPARGLTWWLSLRPSMKRIKVLIEHAEEYVTPKAVALGSVAASAIVGLAISATIFGDYAYAIKFVHAAIYFFSLAEIAANPVQPREASKSYPIALGMVIVTPFLY